MKKIMIFGLIFIIGIAISIGAMFTYHSWKYQKLYDSLRKEEVDVLFLGRPTCGFCNLFKPILEDISKEYHIKYRYINTDDLTKKELEKLLDKLEIRSSTFSTPRLIITKKEKIVDSYIGYMDDISLFHFFKKNGLIEKDVLYQDPYENIERLTSDSYFKILEEKESTNILVGRIGDKETNQYLKEANESNVNLKFLNPGVFLKEEDSLRFQESMGDLKEDTKMPLILVIKDGKVVELIENMDIKK